MHRGTNQDENSLAFMVENHFPVNPIEHTIYVELHNVDYKQQKQSLSMQQVQM